MSNFGNSDRQHNLSDSISGQLDTLPPSSPAAEVTKTASDTVRGGHEDNLEALIQDHVHTIAILQQEHTAVMRDMQTTLATANVDHQDAQQSERRAHEDAIADLVRKHAEDIDCIHLDHTLIEKEMEDSLADGEEQRRQVKMKADQALFELSRIRDEHEIQRNLDLRQIGELNAAIIAVENRKEELKVANTDLRVRIEELDQKLFRSAVAMPPQGPPPNTPLPPLPSVVPAVSSGSLRRIPTDGLKASASLKTKQSVTDISAAIPLLPEPVGQLIEQVTEERNYALSEMSSLKQKLASSVRQMREIVRKFARYVLGARLIRAHS